MTTTSATQLCGVQSPVFQAGMGGVAGPGLVAAVSNAGGLGHLGGIRRSAADLRDWIRETKGLTEAPFGVNLVPPGGGKDGFSAQLEVVLAEAPKVLSLFWGGFAEAIPKAKAAGIVTMAQIGSVAEAREVAALGADIIVAQGIEAGGHVRGTVGLGALLPAVIAAVAPVPVLAAGGLAEAGDVHAALGRGAAGAWVGTRFVATTESLAHEVYKQQLLAAGTDDTQHGHFYSYGWPLGTPYRVIPPLRRSPLNLVAGGARVQDGAGRAAGLKLYAGQGVGRISDIAPAAEVLKRLEGE